MCAAISNADSPTLGQILMDWSCDQPLEIALAHAAAPVIPAGVTLP
jgi:hypothetical protein